MSWTKPAVFLYDFMACTGTILMTLKCHVQEVDHLRETRTM